MKIALELNDTECQVLSDLLTNLIVELEEYRDTQGEYLNATDDRVLDYRIKLRNKIQNFNDLQKMLDEEEKYEDCIGTK